MRAIVSIVVLLLSFQIVPAQSGRQRPRVEPPTSPKPTSTSLPNRVMVPSGGAIIKQEIQGTTSRYVFKNGLTLIVREDHSAPLAAVAINVRAPVQEPVVARTVAHLLSSSSAEFRKNGGLLQVAVGYDHTTYSAVGPSINIQKLLELQMKEFVNRSFTTEETALAGQRALQEEQAKLDDPLEYGKLRVFQEAFGLKSFLAIPTREQAQSFYESNYTGGRIVLVVTGDVSPERVRLTVQQVFGALRPGEQPAHSTQIATEFRYIDERADVAQPTVTLAYRMDLRDAAIVDMLMTLAAEGRGSVLEQALSPFVSRLSAEYLHTSRGGLLIVQVQTSAERLARAEGELFDQIENLRRLVFTPGDLQRARSLRELDHRRKSADIRTLASELAFWESRGGYRGFDEYLKQLGAVTGEQLQQVAARYLAFQGAIIHELQATDAPARLKGADPIYTPERFQALIAVLAARTTRATVEKDEVVAGPDSILVKQGERKEQATEGGFILSLLPQPVRDFSTLNGPRVYVREDQSKPILSVGVYFAGGRLQETSSNSGITEAMLRTILRGTQRASSAEVASRLEQLGAEVSIVNEPDFCGFTMTTLSRNSEEAIRTLVDLIENAAFAEEEFESVKASLLIAARTRRDDPRNYSSYLSDRALYAGHPYGLAPTPESISGLTQKELVDWYRAITRRQFPLVVLVGDTDGSSLVGRVIARGFQRREGQGVLKLPQLALSSSREAVEERNLRQSTLALNFAGPEGRSPEIFALEAVAQLLSFRLSTEPGLRCGVTKRLQQSSLKITTYTAAGKEQEVSRKLLEEIAHIASSLTDDEAEAARAMAATSALHASTDHAQRAILYARALFYGLPASEVDTLLDRYKAITKEDLRKVLLSYVNREHLAVGVLRK